MARRLDIVSSKEQRPSSPNDDLTAALRVEPQGGISKYLQLRNALAQTISKRQWKGGDKLPTEETLVKITGVSLGTVQRALRMLVDDRLVVRRQGMGTFVAAAETPMSAPFYHCQFIDETGGDILPIFSRIVRRRIVTEDGPWASYLRQRRLLCIERQFSINNEFIVYTHLYFDDRRLPGLGRMSIKRLNGTNFKDLLARELGHPLNRFSEWLSVRGFPDYVCKAIKVRAKTSGAVLEIVAYDQRGEAVYFQDLFLPPNERRLIVILSS